MSPVEGARAYSGRVRFISSRGFPGVITTNTDGLPLYDRFLNGYAVHLEAQRRRLGNNGLVTPRPGWIDEFYVHWSRRDGSGLKLRKRDFYWGCPDFEVTIDVRDRSVGLVVPEGFRSSRDVVGSKLILRRVHKYKVPNGNGN